jgi:integrase/recombinase XerD
VTFWVWVKVEIARLMHLAYHKSSLVQDFLDSLWLEDGLSDGSVRIYAMYLRHFSRWLDEHGYPPLERTTLEAIRGFLKAKHRQYSPKTSNLAITVLKRFFHWAIREKCVLIDPTSRVLLVRTSPSFPNCLSERQVQDLLSAIQVDTVLGLRNRAMFELLYASGMRVSELVSLRSINVNLKSRALQIWGKGNKERITIFREIAHNSVTAYIAT